MSRSARMALLCLLAAAAGTAAATTVAQLGFPELVQRSELVFEGRVASVDAARDGASGAIWTRVRFDVLDVLKGPAPGPRIELRFLGGTVGDLTLAVGDMRVPEPGETGIYFVESLARRQSNPLLGWSQGHFVIDATAAGPRRVFTPEGVPVRAVRAALGAGPRRISSGVAAGLDLGARASPAQAMSVDDFKSEIRRLLSVNARN